MPVADTRGVAARRTTALSGLGADVRLAFRMLRRRPWSTLSIAATLGLGIGATTAIYAVFNHVLFRPIPGVSSNASLITVIFQSPSRSASAYGSRAALPAMREAASELEYLADSHVGTLAVAAPSGGEPTFEGAEFVGSQWFTALGVRPRIGRLLTDGEAETGLQNLAVISERLWRAKFGGRPDAIGRTIAVNGHRFVVVGVADRYRGWGGTRVGNTLTDLWLPLGTKRAVTGEAVGIFGTLIGRVRGDASLDVIEAQLRSAYDGVARTLAPRDQAFVPIVYPGLFNFYINAVRTPVLRLYWLLMAAVALLLVLACANAANLLLARASQRERETAVRLAIGAGRWRITRQFLIESLGLAALAGGMGLAVSVLLTISMRGMRLLSSFPDLEGVEIDVRVLTFCLLVTIGTLLAFGLLPALMASRADIRGVLGRAGRAVASRHRLRNGLVIAQMSLSLTLATYAGVVNRSLQNLLASDLGMDLTDVIDLSLKPAELGYDRVRRARVLADTMDVLRQVGFRDVAVSYPGPLTAAASRIGVRTPAMAQAELKGLVDRSVSPDYFQVLRIPLLSGRTFTGAEYGEPASASPIAVILSATLAADLFGSEPAVGRTFGLDRYSGMATLSSTALVVGVAGDTRSSAVRGGQQAVLYHTRQPGYRDGQILVRSDEAAGAAMERIRAVVRQVDPALPITSLRPLRDEVAETLSEDRVLARMGALVALLAAVLAAAGVVSVISQLVTERTRDFGIRTALGASNVDILREVLKGVVAQSMVGIVLGLGLYMASSRWWQSRLFGVGPLDLFTISTAVVALLAIALVAALVPGRRACRIDPAVALRVD